MIIKQNSFGWKVGRFQIFPDEVKGLKFREHFRIGPITGIKIFSSKKIIIMLTDKYNLWYN